MNEDNNRYFLVTFSAEGIIGSVPITTKNGKFFNSIEIAKYLASKLSCHSEDEVIVTNIFEFKSKQDYDDYCSD